MCCDTQKNLRYQKLRSHLNELGYLQPLDTDSLLLVEHLLADYLHTTEKLKYFKETAQNSIRACHNLEISVEPYKSDNAKLVSQVNSLHNQILEQKTKHDEVIHDLRSQLRRLEVERSEVEDLVTLQTSRIQELELESQSKNERLLQLQGLDLKPVISTSVGSKKRSAPLASKKSFTHLEIDPGVRSVKDWQDHYAEINRLNEDPVVVDLVLLTEKRCQKLEKTIKNVEEEKRILYSELELFAKKIADRDSEIDRLQRQVSGGRPAEAVNRDFYTEDSVLSGGDINSTMSDCSSKSVSSKTLWLQQRLEEAIQKQHEAMCHAMRLADHNRMLEAQLKCFLDAKCHCPPAPYSDLNKSSRSDSNQNESLQESFNNGLTELNRRIDELMADNDALKRTSEKSAEEKKKLTNKINELTIVENKLTQEISRLSKINAAQRAQIVDLEDRKDKCKCRKVVQGNLRKASSEIKTQSKTSGTGRFGKRNEKTLPKLGVRVSKLAYKTPGNRRKSYSDLNSSENKDDSEPADLSGNLSASEESHVDSNDHVFGTGDVQKLLEGERKKYEEQIEFLRREQAEHFARLQTEKTKETVNQTPSAVLELLLKEKNYYQTEFHRLLEKQMHDRKDETGDGKAPVSKTSDEMINKIQNEIHKSTHETLTDLITKLNEKEKEILELKHSMQQMTSEKGTGDYFGKQNTLIRSLELEKDLAKRDVKRLEEEKATLINQLSNIKDGQRLGETRISHLTLDFEDRIRKLELERSELISRQASTNLIIENLEHEIDQYRKNLVQSQQEISEQKSLYNHLKLAHEQAERALREFQNNQGHLNQELSCNLDRIQMMETEVATLDRELQNVKIERNNLRTSVKQLDQQKDFLLCKLDDKTERIASMEKEIMKNETVIRQYETTIADLHAKYNLALSDYSKTEESVRRAHNEVENLHKQIKELETTKENLLSENKRIMNDLTTITQEYSSLRAELERSKKEVRELKQQLQLYVDSVKRYEDELSRKEQERSEMLEQFRNLSEETAALEQTNYQVETEVKKTHSSLREAESRVDELQKFIEDKEKKINRYHEELNELRFQLSHLEMETSSLRDEKSRMESDLYASRDLSTIVTSKNDHLVEQLNALTSHKVAMEAEISVLKDGMDDISKKYRESSREMQLMHSQISGYEKELASEVQVNEKLKREVAVLTKQLNELQNNLQSKSTELDRIEKESADHNQEITQLRREVVNARYEQTRADEARSSSQTL